MRFGKLVACISAALLPLGFLFRPPIDARAVDTHSIQTIAASTFSNPPHIIRIVLPVDLQVRGSGASDQSEAAQKHWERGQELAGAGNLAEATAEFREAVALAPNNPRYLATLGAALAQQQNLEEAVRYFDRAHKADPSNVPVLQNLAAAQWQLGRLRDAETNLRQILKLDPSNREAPLILGMVLENLGEYSAAAKLLSSVPDRVKTHPESIAALLHSYYETARLKEAHRLEDDLLADPKDDAQPIFLCATVAVRARDFPAAEKMLSAIRAVAPDPVEIDYELALVRYGAGQYSEAEQILQKLIEQSGESSRYFNLIGWCLAKESKIHEAVKAFDRAIDLDPKKDANYVDLATVLMDAQLLPAALEAANKAVEVDSNSYPAQRIVGQIQTRQHNYEAAVQSYTRAAELNRNDAAASLDLAESQAAAGRFDDACSTLDQSIKKFPRASQLYYHYALILLYPAGADDPKRQSKAIALLQQALALDNSIAGAHYELGNLWLQQGQSLKSLNELQAAAKLDPSDSKAHYALWSVLRKLDRKQQAEDELQIFKKLKSQESAAPQ
jgi:tetratricopeptide (TPR) repeat protein